MEFATPILLNYIFYTHTFKENNYSHINSMYSFKEMKTNI